MASNWLPCHEVQVWGASLKTNILPLDAEEVLTPCAFGNLDPLPQGTHDLLSWGGCTGKLQGQEHILDAVLLHL